MCSDYGNRVPYSVYVEEFSQLKVPLRVSGAIPNLEPRDDIRPTDPAPVIRAAEGGVELVQLRWGFPPSRPKAQPVINFRSEGGLFGKGRCLVPASHSSSLRAARTRRRSGASPRPASSDSA